MKNIKVPSYAKNFGEGLFAGVLGPQGIHWFVCRKCGNRTSVGSCNVGGSIPSGMADYAPPASRAGGPCPATGSGHVWVLDC